MTISGCLVTGEVVGQSLSHTIWRDIKPGMEAWSEYTGGKNTPKSVFRLDETTFFNNDPNDRWEEKVYFYSDPTAGVMPIQHTGYRYLPSGTQPQLLWNIRMASVIGAQLTPSTTPSLKSGDANGDGQVNILDFNLVASHFGQTGSSISGDVNRDGKVNILDFNIVVSHFGQ